MVPPEFLLEIPPKILHGDSIRNSFRGFIQKFQLKILTEILSGNDSGISNSGFLNGKVLKNDKGTPGGFPEGTPGEVPDQAPGRCIKKLTDSQKEFVEDFQNEFLEVPRNEFLRV